MKGLSITHICWTAHFFTYFNRRIVNYLFSHTRYGHLRFYSEIEILILSMLSYQAVKRRLFIGRIGTHAHGRQVTSSLSQSDVTCDTASLSTYSGLYESLVFNI